MPRPPPIASAPAAPRRPARGLSIIGPLYNEAENLPLLHERLIAFAGRLAAERGLASEVVYVDDGSRDETLNIARALSPGVSFQVVSFSRNFGKEAALLAGLDHARFDALLFMDGDGQHPPELADQLVKYWLEVSMEEQTRRFEARIHDGRKIWKLSPMDLESHRRWYDYTRARDDMFAATDVNLSPWHVVDSNVKRRGRLNCISHLLSMIPYTELPHKKVKLPDRLPAGDYESPDHPFRFVPKRY